MTVSTSYSAKMKRLFLNVGFAPTAAFFKKTSGLCGFMDDDVTNDLKGPDGTLFNDTVAFVESCEYITEMKPKRYTRDAACYVCCSL